jgi:Ca-activated chloride channel family protein
MATRWSERVLLFLLFLGSILLASSFLPSSAAAQSIGFGADVVGVGPQADETQAQLFMLDLMTELAQRRHSQLEKPSEGVSKLDLKAPSSARGAYEKGASLLLKNDANGSIQHLSRALAIYPKFVAAHNALGSAYMDLGKSDQAREQFQQATLLDDHLPNSFSNLCRAELTLKHYPAAEQAIKKASSLSPLNLDLLVTQTYAQLMNHNYNDAIATAHQVHSSKHEGASVVHFFAAAAWREQNNLPEMKVELTTFLAEDPKSSNAERARKLIAQIDGIHVHPKVTVINQGVPSEAMLAAEQEEGKELAEAERMCVGCPEGDVSQPAAPVPGDANPRLGAERIRRGPTGWVLRKNVDEVALFFAATDHGRAVSDLTRQDVGIRDDHQPPASVVDFRNESELPLRLGLVIDTSESIVSRFSFEQGAAAGFLQKVLINKDDLAFVVGFSNSVLMVQDFTSDQGQISHAIGELAPAGGTSLWDAVAFASSKLASRVDPDPVAKILVVISDGNDNSSKTTLKQAIQAAVRGEVIVYTVSTAESSDADYRYTDDYNVSVGNRALKALADQTGGSEFAPGSVMALKRGLAELQQVIRSRYMIAYKPARFEPDGHYRAVDVDVQKSGHRLRVYARKGYYSRTDGQTTE